MSDKDLVVEDSTVDTVMALHPATMAVFNEFGVDTCCGSHSSVREAATRDGVDEAALVAALRRAIAGIR